MQRESPYPMVSIDDALALVAAHTPLLGAERVALADLLGRVLAEDIVSDAPLPDVPKSVVDGYALRSADGAAPRRVLGEVTAGGAAGAAIGAGEALRIMTGAALPAGADAVIMVEQTEEIGGVLSVQRAPRAGDAINPAGADMRRGEDVLRRGAAVGVAEVALLATLGRASALAARRPLVAVLSTGDEVYEPDALPAAGGVRDSNRYALLAAAREAGCAVISLGIARDDEATQRAAILDGIARADVLLTSGGVSMGTRDLVKPLLAELGMVHFGRVAFKPGKPTTFATIGQKLAFGLPGNPVSSLVSFEVFVRPALRRMQGAAQPGRPLVRVTLVEPIRSSQDRPEYHRAVASLEDGRLVARSTGAQASSRLLSLRDANLLLLVPPGGQVYQPGETLEGLLIGPIATG